MLRKCKILIIFSIIFLTLLGSNYIANADMGPKPSITIHLKNMKTNNYIIDLFEYAEKNEDYYLDSNYSSNDYVPTPFPIIEIDGIKDKNFDEIAKRRRNNSRTS